MPIRIAILTLAFLSVGAQAQSPSDPPCQYSSSRRIPFASPTSNDRLTVSIGSGACHSAKLSFVVVSATGRVLYAYVAPFKKHTATQWDDPSLPEEAREFVNDLTSRALVPRNQFPTPKPEDQTLEGEATLTVPQGVFKRLVLKGQPMLYHPTYYEGGQYVMFDPVTRAVRVVAVWGV
ncbi:hypothetical protein [Caldimonas sp. KR1-144]|uniref:hypothetical protein n=1 Tax=Caldimonas sp. KR1-144 TaxID=3400911 RepID=UPI003C11B2EA